jgi:hypothetical protein
MVAIASEYLDPHRSAGAPRTHCSEQMHVVACDLEDLKQEPPAIGEKFLFLSKPTNERNTILQRLNHWNTAGLVFIAQTIVSAPS